MATILDIPKDVWLIILSHTGCDKWTRIAIGCDILYPDRADAMNLYCTCKHFKFLKEFRFMVRYDNEYEIIWYTVTLNGVKDGPSFYFMKIKDYAVSSYLSGVQIFDKGRSISTCITIMKASNHFAIKCDREYPMNDYVMTIEMFSVLNQWKRSKDISYKFLIEDDNKFSNKFLVKYQSKITFDLGKKLREFSSAFLLIMSMPTLCELVVDEAISKLEKEFNK